MTAPMVDYKIHWLKMMSVPESRAVVGRHDGINGRDSSSPRHDTPAEPVRTTPPDTSPRLPVRATLTEGYTRSHFGPPQPDQPAASVGDYCAAVLTLGMRKWAHGF